MEYLTKLPDLLAIVGAVVVGLPVLLRALHAIFLAIPGEFGDKQVEKLLVVSEKAAELVTKVFPQKKV